MNGKLISVQSCIARLDEGEEIETEIRRTLIKRADDDDPDRRGFYQVDVVVTVK